MQVFSSKPLACAPWRLPTSWQMGINLPPCDRVWLSHASFFRAAPHTAPFPALRQGGAEIRPAGFRDLRGQSGIGTLTRKYDGPGPDQRYQEYPHHGLVRGKAALMRPHGGVAS